MSVGCIDYQMHNQTFIAMWPELYTKDMQVMLDNEVPPIDMKDLVGRGASYKEIKERLDNNEPMYFKPYNVNPIFFSSKP